ncbi:biotin carboxyl carrier protein of acetyl-CoA carboxylase 1, chloroplastic-like isoform X2 [Rutidosis leptorrhynchoides]|uniref:biotin carboxyl carrier protein of acetyl-CoA carboxylase 1, chloroplastic-like isoform X2 n=1 Tax=Rutidosis leptorrhynchoides TaxID=125765 RepID=UPI003A99A007
MSSSFSVPCPKTCALIAPNLNPNKRNHRNTSVVLFHSDLKPNFSLVSKPSSSIQSLQNGAVKVSAKLDEVAHEKSSKDKSDESSKISSKDTVPDIASFSAFMNQVAGLVELVDSRDIMELQLKQDDYEVVIRKKEALPPPPAPPMMVMQSSQPQAMFHSQPAPPQAAAPPSAAAPSASPPTLPAASKPKSSHPPLKCPMAGTFYRAPAPGAPPFVKVGDKVQKGQVICIIEAMKLMNEIEADQSGTIVDIIAEDGKPVSLDTPLLVIEP